MISSPITPRARLGLRDFVRQRTELLECGLLLVQEDLDLGGGAGGSCIVDALARDALGTPVFVFTCDEDAARVLPGRILEVDGWFRRHGDALLRALADAGYKEGASPRFLVVAYEIEPALLERLERLGVQRLEALQVCCFSLRGELWYDVEHKLPTDQRRELSTGVLPSITEPRARELCACVLDLLQRIDPRVVTTGDRFSRRFSLGGSLLSVLRYDESGLTLVVGTEPRLLQCWDDVVDAVDIVLRSWHLGVQETSDQEAGQDGVHKDAEADGADRLAKGNGTYLRESHGASRLPPFARSSQRISLEALRRSVASSRLSRDECDALAHHEDEREVI